MQPQSSVAYIDRYLDVHTIFAEWVEKGDLKLTISFDGSAELDVLIFKLFGYIDSNEHFPKDLYVSDIQGDGNIHYGKCLAAVCEMNKDISRRDVDLDWLLGPHALTIVKAKIAIMEQNA